MGDLNEPSRGVAQLCWFDETDHSDAGSRGLALLSQQLRVRVPRADCPDCVTCQKKKKRVEGAGWFISGFVIRESWLVPCRWYRCFQLLLKKRTNFQEKQHRSTHYLIFT